VSKTTLPLLSVWVTEIVLLKPLNGSVIDTLTVLVFVPSFGRLSKISVGLMPEAA
jgi:hypothetical protein